MPHMHRGCPRFRDFLRQWFPLAWPARLPATICVTMSLALSGAQAATAQTLLPGDILVVDASIGVIHVDPETGIQTVLTQGGFLNTSNNTALDLAVGADGQIFVLDVAITLADGSSAAGIVRVDPATGAQTLVSRGQLLTFPRGIALESDGHIVVTDQVAGTPPRVIRIDPVTGAQRLVTTDMELSSPRGIAVVSIKKKLK